MAYTTTSDYAQIVGDLDDDLTRAAIWLPSAERWVARQAGRVFYDAAAPTGDASEDWKLVTSLVVYAWRRAEIAHAYQFAAAQSSSDGTGIQSRTITDDGTTKSITYRSPSAAVSISASVNPLVADPRIAEILAAYTLIPVTAMRTRLAERGDQPTLAEYQRADRNWWTE